METAIKDCTPAQLEERAMLGDANAAAELSRRYRTGSGGLARDDEAADLWRDRAESLDPDVLSDPEPEAPVPEAPADAPAYDRGQDEVFAQWHSAYVQGRYQNALSRELQAAEKGGNPYAAFVLAQRYRTSESAADRAEARPLLERTRAVLEKRVASTADPDACSLLVQVLTLLGHLYADEATGEAGLQKAWECFVNAHELDETACEGLLWFCSGPARRMERFANDPDGLEKFRFALAEQAAERQGIGPRLEFALQCRRENRLLKARDWLQLALDAPDAASQPALCAVARYCQAELAGETPDLTPLQDAAPHSAWACLILGDQAGQEADRLAWYARGAALQGDPKAEDCRRKQEEILNQREEAQRLARERERTARAAAEAAAARKAAEEQEAARRKAAEEQEAAARKAAEERLRREQDAQYARWSDAARSGTYETCLSSELQAAEQDGNPYAAYVLAQRYLRSSGMADRAKALPTLEHCRALLEGRCAAAQDAGAAALLVEVLTLLAGQYTAMGGDEALQSAQECLTTAYRLDDRTLETLLAFYNTYGSQLPEYRRDPQALEACRAPLAEKSARQGGIVRRLRFALYCQQQGRSVTAADWLRLALAAPDAADHPAVCSVARYYQDIMSGQTPDLSSLREAADRSSWACLVLGDQSQDPAEQQNWYRQGEAIDPAAEGEESMAAVCRSRCETLQRKAEEARQAEEARREAQRREAEARRAEAERAAAAEQERQQRLARLGWWDTAYQAGDYANALSNALQTGLEEGNPYAAFVLAQRCLSSGSAADRREAVEILGKARHLSEQYLTENELPGLRSLLSGVLQLLGRCYAAEGASQDDLKNAHECLLTACRQDPNAVDTLLWFYQGPAKGLQQFIDHPEQLEKNCFALQEQAAREGGILPRLRLALYCREKKRNVKAKDWLNLALSAPDAPSRPALCAIARFYLAQCNNQKADLTDLTNAAAQGSSWACLLLGDLARGEDQKLTLYSRGAAIDPAGEEGASRAADCARRRDEIYRRRAAAHNEELSRRKQAEADARRRAEDARQGKAQWAVLKLCGILFLLCTVAFVVLNLVGTATGSGLWLLIAWGLAFAWPLLSALLLVATFLGFCPAVYRGHLLTLRITLAVAIALTLLVPMALDTLL